MKDFKDEQLFLAEYYLLPTQESIYLDQIKSPDNPKYNIGGYIRFNGGLDWEKYCEAVNEVVNACDAFSVTFERTENGITQLFHRHESPKLEVVDLTDEPDPEKTLKAVMSAAFEVPFALDGEYLMFQKLYKVGEDEWFWFIKCHHLIIDGHGFVSLCQKIAEVYNKICCDHRGAGVDLPSYKEHVVEEQKYLSSDKYRKDKEYWESKLSSIPEPLYLPRGGDFDRAVEEEYFSTRELTANLVESLSRVCDIASVNLLQLVVASISICVTKYAEQDAVLLGLPLHNRRNKKQKAMVGTFMTVSNLVVRCGWDETVIQFVKSIKASQLADYRHQRFPLAHLTREKGAANVTPDIMVIYDQFAFELPFQNVDSNVQQVETTSGESPFQVRVVDYGSSLPLKIRVNGNKRYVNSNEPKLLLNRIINVLSQLEAGLNENLNCIQVLPSDEREFLIEKLNSTHGEFRRSSCIHQLFEEQASKKPESIAVVCGCSKISYGELNKRANRLARYLIELGAKPDSLVGICLDRSVNMVVSMLAILKAGAAYVPLDPGYPVERLSFMLGDADIVAVISKGELEGILPEWVKPKIIDLAGDDFQKNLCSLDDGNSNVVGLTSGNLAYVIYTSGSTGKPKGVMIEHRNAVNLFDGLNRAIKQKVVETTQIRWLASTSLSFDISVLEIFWSLSNGAEITVQKDKVSRSTSVSARTDAMEFSLFYFASDNTKSTDDKYELLMDGALFADQNKFKSIWIPERHFHSFGGQYPSPAVAAAAIAVRTSNVGIRTGSIVLPLHDPIQVAEEWSMIDHLSCGRVGLSFASGWHPNDFIFVPDNYDQRNDILKARIKEFKDIWSGKPCRRINGIGKEVEVVIRPDPKQSMPPIWITAAGNPETFRYAGEIGANVLTHLLGQTKEELSKNIEIYKDALASNGHTHHAGVVTLMLHTFLGDSLEFVQDTVSGPFKRYLKDSIGLMKPIAEEAGLDLKKDEETIIEIAYERFFNEAGLFGTPEGCLHKINELHSIGVDEIGCLVDFGVEPKITLEHLDHLKELSQLTKQSWCQKSYFSRIADADNKDNVTGNNSVTHMQITPSHLSQLLEMAEGKELVGSLKQLLVGGEAWPTGLVDQLEEVTSATVFNMYGPTETTVWSTASLVENGRVSMGGSLLNTQLYVLDGEMNPVPVGVPGELYIGGEGVARGYYKRPDLTEERFVANTFSSEAGSRLYRTGDIVRWLPDSSMEFLGRKDDQVKVRGHRVELGEIESILVKNPLVKKAVVAANREGRKQRLVAYVIFNESYTGEAVAILHSYLLSRLPDYMVPSHIVPLESFPLTPNGKVDKYSLPSPDSAHIKREYIAPVTESEKMICKIWEDVLEIGQVGLNDDFFLLGGHSLLAIRMLGKIKEKLGVEVAINELLGLSTVAEFVENIDYKRTKDKNEQLQLKSGHVEEVEW